MSVERLTVITNDDGKYFGMREHKYGEYILFRDYERDCIKGRCPNCKNGNVFPNRGTIKGQSFRVYCQKHLCEKPPEGYCDEWEARNV